MKPRCNRCGTPRDPNIANFVCSRCGTKKRPGAVERFWSKVDKSGDCWEWRGPRQYGYGVFSIDGKNVRAHRHSWSLHHGDVGDGFVLHGCHNRACVRPEHLRIGTHEENMADMKAANRQATGDRHGTKTHPDSYGPGKPSGWQTKPERMPRGERHGAAKLNAADVREVRSAYASGSATQVALAKRYGVTQSAISSIVRMETWR